MANKTVKRKPGNKDVIINQIDIRPIQRQTQDIKKWRDAIQAAEGLMKNRTSLYDLYKDIELDGHLESVVGKRQNAIKNTPIVYVNNGKEDEEINKLINSEQFDNLIVDLLDSKFWGFTLTQINNIFFDEDEEKYIIDYDLIPRKHVKPELGIVTKNQTDQVGLYNYLEPPTSKYCIWAGKKDDLGLFMKIAQYVIYKRGDFGDWAQYAEVFGMPFREYEYDPNDPKMRFELEKIAEAYAGAGFSISPQGSTFKLHQATTAASSNTVYKDLKTACNEEISKAIVGQTMTTDNGSSRSQAEVHQDAENEIKEADRAFIIDILNGKFKAVLKAFGFNVSGGEFKYKINKKVSELKERLDIDIRISERQPVSDEYFYEEYGIPKPDNYDELKKELKEKNTPGKVDVDQPQEIDREQKPSKVKNFFNFFQKAPVK